ncbi:taste receptor type 2 member 9-like [Dendropsophus ebraccatus]|uniref:taste receptor type 2 member 9-like n=1 Tax=Dendropsophus ebraccatus TaxID=150705 RepID=UPI0038319348
MWSCKCESPEDICICLRITDDPFAFLNHTTPSNMDTAELAALIITVSIELVLGMALNLYILLVYIGNLKNGVSLGPSDKVHLTKALVNVSMIVTMNTQCIMCYRWSCLLLTKEFFLGSVIIVMFLIFYNYWLTAMLCVYYCTSITTCGHHIFVWLKRSLSSYLLPILLVLGLCSFAVSIPAFWFGSLNPPRNSTGSFQVTFVQTIPYRITFTILGCILPLTIVLLSTTITSWSLINHMWRMRKNNGEFPSSKFQTQINATRTMILFLLISVIYCLTEMAFSTITISPSLVILIWFYDIFYPISEAVIIIQGSAKLRRTLLEKFINRKEKNCKEET